jgi:nitronate monooxygenase
MGFAFAKPAKVAESLKRARSMTKGPINANFFIFNETAEGTSSSIELDAVAALERLDSRGGTKLTIPTQQLYPDSDAVLEPIWANPPDILTFHFGIPKMEWIELAHSLEITIGVSATSIAEAKQIQAAGLDFIIAQGIEAGGHRGTFHPDGKDEDLPCIALVRQIAQSGEISLPIVAAGGIMDGNDIHRMIEAGATAVQCGTAFLTCDESGASKVHKQYLQQERGRGTALTSAFSGRRAQGIRNKFIEQMWGQPVLPFPAQMFLSSPLRKGADGDGEYQSLWAGSEYARTRPMPAAELMELMRQEYASASAPRSAL